MSRIVGTLFIVLVVTLMLIPAPAFASLGEDCSYDAVKWEDNPDSYFLYLQNWGKTPISAMSRLAGLAHPDVLHDFCNQSGSCSADRATGCDVPSCEGGCCCAGSNSSGCCVEGEVCKDCITKPTGNCCCCWGISLCFANKGWGSCEISMHPRVNNDHPNHMTGDWGVSGCPHPECVADSWCLPDNLCTSQL
jgi:hypothetical protein